MPTVRYKVKKPWVTWFSLVNGTLLMGILQWLVPFSGMEAKMNEGKWMCVKTRGVNSCFLYIPCYLLTLSSVNGNHSKNTHLSYSRQCLSHRQNRLRRKWSVLLEFVLELHLHHFCIVIVTVFHYVDEKNTLMKERAKILWRSNLEQDLTRPPSFLTESLQTDQPPFVFLSEEEKRRFCLQGAADSERVTQSTYRH